MSKEITNNKKRGHLENLVADLRDDYIHTEASNLVKMEKLAEPKVGKEIKIRNPLPRWVPLLVAFITVGVVVFILVINRVPASTDSASNAAGTDIPGLAENNPETIQAIPVPTLIPEPAIEIDNQEIPEIVYELVEQPPLPEPPEPTPEPDPEVNP